MFGLFLQTNRLANRVRRYILSVILCFLYNLRIFLTLFAKNAQKLSNLSNDITDFSDSTGKSLQTKNKTNEIVKTKGFVIGKLK